jgi:apolipoprotein N-acyltransferase
LRSIWTDARRAHRAGAQADGQPGDGQPSAPGAAKRPVRATRQPAQDPAARATAATARPSGQAGWGGLGRWRSLGVAIAAGLALAGAFPPVGIWPLAIAGPALLTLAVFGKRTLPAFGLGLACGVLFFVGLLSWLINVAWYAWAALAGLEAVIFAVTVIALPPLLRLRGWPLAVAGWWVAQEAIRDRMPWGGFPWGRLAMSQASAPTAGWSAIGGPPVLTFLLALAGACLAYLVITVLTGHTTASTASPAVSTASPVVTTSTSTPASTKSTTTASARGQMDSGIHPRFPGWIRGSIWPLAGRPGETGRRQQRTVTAIALAVLAIGLLLSGDLAWSWTPGRGPTAVIATIQGNVPHSRTLPDQLRATTVTSNHAAATLALAQAVRAGRRPAPDVVIWPENSTDIDPSESPATRQTIALAVAAIDRPVLVGAVLDHPVRNAGQLWLPNRGPTQLYVKRKLVPFGEVIPYRSFLELFTSLPLLQPRNFTPGHRAVVFRIGKVRLGDVICYEVGFDNLVRSEVTAGANVLAVQTNDADFELDGQQGETLQQLEMARIDAITTGRAVAVASTIGVSAIIAPDGHVITASKTWRRAELDARVPLESALTPADRAGSWPELIIVISTALALLWSMAERLRQRGR